MGIEPAWDSRAHELELARGVQQRMVPTEPLQGRPAELAFRFRPAAEIGGDFLDFFWLDPQQLVLYLGDVAGKGLAAALYGALVAGTLRGFHKSGVSPPALVELLNQRLRIRPFPGHYCAVQYAVFNPSSGEIRYVSAGLPPPLHITATGCVQLDGGGLPPALFDDSRYETFAAQLAPGDAVLFATDGLTDARNAEGEEFGMEQLVEVCARHRKESAETLLSIIFEALDTFVAGAPQHDDITAALLKIS